MENGEGARNMDARTLFFYSATVNTPAMAAKMIGRGSQYGFCAIDSDGNNLDGSKNYKPRIPANVPAKDFWSVVVYDPQTVPGKGWFVLIRLYGPLETWFDRSWKPGEFELVD